MIFGGGFHKFNLMSLEWERSSAQTEDFMTLIRQLVYIVLGFQGVIAREFITLDGYFIVTVCFAHEFNTKMVVEYLRMKKFLDVSFIDLMGLEPLDDKRRPLRLHENIQDSKLWTLHYGPENKELFERIRKVTAEINFPKMVREFKGVWGKDMIREENSRLQIYQHAQVPLATWKSYLVFLKNLAGRVKDIRIEFRTKQVKLKANFFSKYEGFTDFGMVLKQLTMKTEREDYFFLENMQAYLREKMKSRLTRLHAR